MKIYSLFTSFVAIMIFLDPKHVYGGNLRALEEAESLINTTSAAIIGQRELGKGGEKKKKKKKKKKKCKEDSDCHNDKYGPCGQCIKQKCKKKKSCQSTSGGGSSSQNIACGDKCSSQSDCENTDGCSLCKDVGLYGECRPRCMKGAIHFSNGSFQRFGHNTNRAIVGGPCRSGYTRSHAKVTEFKPTRISCGPFNSGEALTSVWASRSKSDCRLKIEYDVHTDGPFQAAGCGYSIRQKCTNP